MNRIPPPNVFKQWSPAQYFEYLKARCTINERGCWIHPGRQTKPRGSRPGSLGYVQCCVKNKRWMVHRWMYTYAKGPIPPGHVVGHECDTPPCCNPDHLKAITELENSADMIAKRRNYEQQRTHCPRNHEYSEENTVWKIAASGRPCRECKTCVRMRSRLRSGWSKDEALTHPKIPAGYSRSGQRSQP